MAANAKATDHHQGRIGAAVAVLQAVQNAPELHLSDHFVTAFVRICTRNQCPCAVCDKGVDIVCGTSAVLKLLRCSRGLGGSNCKCGGLGITWSATQALVTACASASPPNLALALQL